MDNKNYISILIDAFKGSSSRWQTIRSLSRETNVDETKILELISKSNLFIIANKNNNRGEALFALREKKALESASFIFQSLPEKYDLREKLVPGRIDTWYATRFRNKMTQGDIVFFWMAGDKRIRGLYGWGKMVSEPYIKEGWDTYGVDVEYVIRFKSPISSSIISSDKELSELLIFRAPQATNFILNEYELKKMIKLINSVNEESPEI